MEEIDKIDEKTISPRKLAAILTSLDLLLIKEVTAADLIKYDGNTIPQSVSHIQNKNTGLFHWISITYDYKYIIKMLKRASVDKNYNLMNILIKAIQTKKLSNKKIEKLVFYKELLNNQDNGIVPFEWMLKDCEDSNVNVESDIASMRFCKIVEKLKEMKKMGPNGKVKETYKQFVYEKIWKNLEKTVLLNFKEENKYDGMYLLFE